MSTAYLSQLPREFMRVITGFSRLPGNYHLRRAEIIETPNLALDSWLARYDACIVSGLSFANCDLAGKSFLDLLDWLRDILLQDAAVLQHQFPLPAVVPPCFLSPGLAPFRRQCSGVP